VETAEGGKINFITDMIYQQANGHDGNIHDQLLSDNKRAGLEPKKLFADSNYLSGELIKRYRDHGQELMGYMQGYAGREKAFQTEAFEVDIENRQAVCPAGHRSIKSGCEKPDIIIIYFDSKRCGACEFFYRCVRMNNKSATRRLIKIRPYYEFRRERRLAQQTDWFRKEMRVRAQVEGTISEGTRFHGLRYARYRGKDGHQLQFYQVGAAINMKRFVRAIGETEKEMNTTRN
jgi:hypothetical protein